MKKINVMFVSIFMILVMLNSVLGQVGDFSEVFGVVNSEFSGQMLSGPVAKVIGNERINFHIEGSQGETWVVGVVIEDKVIQEIKVEALEDATLNIFVSEETILGILNSDKPVSELKKVLDENGLQYKAVGLINKVKFGFVSMLVKTGLFLSDEDNEGVDGLDDGEIDVQKAKKIVVVDTEKESQINDDLEESDVNNLNEGLTGAVVNEENGQDINGKVNDEVASTTFETHLVNLINGGFEIDLLEINAGDKVVWQNVREANTKKAMIIGAAGCSNIKSEFFNPGEHFSWTFDEPGRCMVVDAMFTTQTMKIVIN